MSTVFEAVDLRKDYENGRIQALRGANFRIEAGEFVAVIGRSGSGKSTLLQMLGALDRPSGGLLRYRGQPVPEGRKAAAYRACDIGFIFQSFHLLPTFTALENVQIPMFEGRLGARDRRARAVKLLEAVGLGHRLDHLPSQLSGGERQRVAVARSLANGPGVLLADEPTGNLDSENAREVLDLIVRVQAEQGMTLILVTHDPEIAARAGRTLVMGDGVVRERQPEGVL